MPVITIKKGCLVKGHWLKKGQTAKVGDRLAEWLLKNKLAEIGGSVKNEQTGEEEKNPPPVTSELDGWPGDEALKKAGLDTVAALRGFIAQHGDAWPKQVNGVGKATAAEIIEKLEALSEENNEDK